MNTFKNNEGVFTVTDAKESGKYGFGFKNTGKYTVHAALADPISEDAMKKFNTKAEAFRNAEDELMNNISNQKTIEATSSSSSKDYASFALFVNNFNNNFFFANVISLNS